MDDFPKLEDLPDPMAKTRDEVYLEALDAAIEEMELSIQRHRELLADAMIAVRKTKKARKRFLKVRRKQARRERALCHD